MMRHRSGGQQELKPSMIKFNVGCNTISSDWIKFISWYNQSLHCSRIVQNHVLILKHLTALRPEKKAWSFSQVVWVIRNSDSTTIFLGVLKYWKPSCIVFLFRGSEILYPLLCCLGDQKFWISCVVWESEILNLLCCLGIRNSESSPVLFGGSETLNPLLCCLGDQKFWILSCVVWGSEILNPLLCFLGIRNSESSPVLIGGSEILNPECCLGVRNSESPSVLLGDQKFRILSRVVWGIFRKLLGRILWSLANRETFPMSFNTSLTLRVNCKTRLWN